MTVDRLISISYPFLIQASVEPHFLQAMQQIVDQLIPESFWPFAQEGCEPELAKMRIETDLMAQLPLFRQGEIEESAKSFALSYLCPAEYTHQARRFVVDTLSRWLVPGRSVEICGGISLFFEFASAPGVRFFAAQDLISIRNPEERLAIQTNVGPLVEQLKRKLPCEFTRKSEHSVHPIFLPRNEEDTIRNLIVLSEQIQFVKDLPQVSIHYERQTDIDLIFTVIIARLFKKNSLRKLLEKSRFKMEIDDMRVLGLLKQKYPKEGAILRITVNKRPFFRPDDSIDLLKARQKIVSGLTEILGEVRDFNGGMILKQEEALTQLRLEIGNSSAEREFLLENYFYSLKPAIMQTVHETSILKKHFELFNAILATDFKLQPFEILGAKWGKFFLFFVGSSSSQFRSAVLDAIHSFELPSRNLTTTFLEMKNICTLGVILRVEPDIGEKLFAKTIQALEEWNRKFYCIVT